MILTIDTDKEQPERLREIARFLERLASDVGSSVDVSGQAADSAEDFSFSEEAFSAVFDAPQPRPQPQHDIHRNRDVRDDRDRDDFRVQPY